MVVTVLGSGTDPIRLLLDCGSGVVHNMARFRLPWHRLTHILVSHFHTDHVGDLPSLLFSLKHGLSTPRSEQLTIVGPAGTRDLLQRMAAAFGDHVLDPGFPVRIRELAAGEVHDLGDVARLTSRATPHTDASLAFRLETPDATLGYTGDTGMDDGLGAFFRGVDVLICECSLPDALAMDTHLTPSRVARIAAGARPRHLLLTHIYPQLESEDVPDRVRAAGWDGPIRVASDGMQILV